jgi:hypothetical protein
MPKAYTIILKPLSNEQAYLLKKIRFITSQIQYKQSQLSKLLSRICKFAYWTKRDRDNYIYHLEYDLQEIYPELKTHKANLLKLENDPNAKQRVIYADFVKVIDGGTLLAGIDPTHRESEVRAITSRPRSHGKSLQIRKNNPEFYDVKNSRVYDTNDRHTNYIITKKFNKILSINLDNIISINGKKTSNRIDPERGLKHLDVENEGLDWINEIAKFVD